MSIEWILYLINCFDSLDVIAILVVIFWFIFLIVLSSYGVANEGFGGDEEKAQQTFNLFKKSFYILIPAVCLVIFLPSEKTMYLMVGAHYLKDSKVPVKVEAVIEKKLDEYLKPKGSS